MKRKKLKRTLTGLVVSVLLSGIFVPGTQVFALVTGEEAQELRTQLGKEIVNGSDQPSYIFETPQLHVEKYPVLPGEKVIITKIFEETGVAEVFTHNYSGTVHGFMSLEELLALTRKTTKTISVQVKTLPRRHTVSADNFQRLAEEFGVRTGLNLRAFSLHDQFTEKDDSFFRLELDNLPPFPIFFSFYRKIADETLPSVIVSLDHVRLLPSFYIFGLPDGKSQADVPSCVNLEQTVPYTTNSSFYNRFASLSSENQQRVLRYLLEYYKIFIAERNDLFTGMPAFSIALNSQRKLFPQVCEFELTERALSSLNQDISEKMPFAHQLFINFSRVSDSPQVLEPNCKCRLLLTMEESQRILEEYHRVRFGT